MPRDLAYRLKKQRTQLLLTDVCDSRDSKATRWKHLFLEVLLIPTLKRHNAKMTVYWDCIKSAIAWTSYKKQQGKL